MTTTTSRPTPAGTARPAAVTVNQYSRRAIFAIWAAAALPMAALAWIVAPAVAGGTSPEAMFGPLVVLLTAGLVWQFVLVLGLVGFEQRSLRWSRVKPALWLQRPVSPKTGRSGGRTWLVLVPLVAAFGLVELLPSLSPPVGRDFGEFLSSSAGRAMFHGSWGWFAVVVTLFVFNTVLGEELLFRGVLLPRMAGAYGDRDWVVNGLLFAGYHLHVPWAIFPSAFLDMFLLAYPSRRYRSAWIGIAVHSAQSVVFTVVVLTLVV